MKIALATRHLRNMAAKRCSVSARAIECPRTPERGTHRERAFSVSDAEVFHFRMAALPGVLTVAVNSSPNRAVRLPGLPWL